MRTCLAVALLVLCCVPLGLAAPPVPGISFVARRDFEIPADLIATTDLNGDGKPDLVIADGGASISVLLGNGDGTFQPPTTYPVPQFSQFGDQFISSLAIGDFNHDGKPDVAVAISLPGSTEGFYTQNPSGDLLVFLGNGDGTLQPPTTIALTYAALSLVQTDVNGDGIQDLVLLQADYYDFPYSEYISAEVSVLLGNGDGTFKAPINTSVPAEAIELAVGDLNGDGKPDVVTANQQSFSILLGNGDGTFQTPVTLAVAADSVALADFTGNGKLDLVTSFPVAGGGTTLSVFLGNGNGTFQNPTITNVGETCTGPFIGDLNGDGRPDVVVTCDQSGVVVLLGNGDGTFGTPGNFTAGGYTESAVIADFNGDGKADLATANSQNISILLGKGDGTFIGAVGAVPTLSGQSMITADFNRDGKADLAVGTAVNGAGLVVELGNGNGTFTQSFVGDIGVVDLLAAADFNQDGKLDIVAGASTGLSVFLGNGDGTFQPPISVVSEKYTFFIAIADFNLDGKPDLVVVNQDGTILYIGNGDGTFQTGLVISSEQVSVVAGDFNRDGKPDLIIGYSEGGTAVLLLGNGDGTFQSPVPLPTIPVGGPLDPGLEVLSVGDFNNDGKLDLAVVNPSIESLPFVAIALGNGDGTFQTAVTQNAPEGPGSYVLADMNGDGNLDLVTVNGYNVSVWLGNGDGTLQAPQDFGAGPDLANVAAADFNQDGLPDLAVIGTTPPGPWMLFQTGTARVPVPTLSPNSLTFASQAIGTTSAPQIVNLTVAGNAPLNIAQIVTSGDFAQTNNCPNSIPVGSGCTIKVTFTPTTGGTRSGSLTVEDNAPNDPQNVSLSGTSPSDIALGVAPGGSSSATVGAGSMATYKLSIGGGGFSGTASLTCTGAPQGANCSFPSGATINVSGSSASPFNVTVTTTSRATAAFSPSSTSSRSWLWAVLLIGVVILPNAKRKERSAWRIIRLWPLLLLVLLSACGGGGSTSTNPIGTPAGTYSLTVTATSGSVKQSVPLTLTVQ
jgi:hypothetical protein